MVKAKSPHTITNNSFYSIHEDCSLMFEVMEAKEMGKQMLHFQIKQKFSYIRDNL